MPKLRIERLAELSTDELTNVNGAAIYAVTTQPGFCVPTLRGCTTNIYCP